MLTNMFSLRHVSLSDFIFLEEVVTHTMSQIQKLEITNCDNLNLDFIKCCTTL